MPTTKHLKKYKVYLKASSLMETIIAVTIISVCIGIASLVYANSVSRLDSIALLNARQEVTKIMTSNNYQLLLENKNIKKGGYTITTSNRDYTDDFDTRNDKNSLKILIFDIVAGNKKERIEHLIMIPAEKN